MRVIAALAIGALVALGSTVAAHAGTSHQLGASRADRDSQLADAPRPGDLFWQFSRTGPLADSRFAAALGILVDSESVIANAGLAPGRRLLYGDAELQRLVEEPSPETADQLLAAAGIVPTGQPAQVREARRCRIWTPTGLATDADRLPVATALGEAVAAALAGIGVDVQPCEVVTDSSDADLVLWDFGYDSPVTVPRIDGAAAGFLEIIASPPDPGASGCGPFPPASGLAGLAAAESTARSPLAVAGFAAGAVLLTASARRLTGAVVAG